MFRFLTYRGRVSRRAFWLASLAHGCTFLTIWGTILIALGFSGETPATLSSTLIAVTALTGSVVQVHVATACLAARLRDARASQWFVVAWLLALAFLLVAGLEDSDLFDDWWPWVAVLMVLLWMALGVLPSNWLGKK